jgi:hypothetical protein
MAEPNLLSPSSIKGKTAFVKQVNLQEVKLILENPINSGKIFKINALSVYRPGSTGYFFIVNADFPYSNNENERFKYDQFINGAGNAGVNRWTVINKNEMLYIPENTALWYHDGASPGFPGRTITISYEEIS